MGIHGSPTCVIDMEDALGYLIGEPHKGMKVMFTMMNAARLHVAVEGICGGRDRLPDGGGLRERPPPEPLPRSGQAGPERPGRHHLGAPGRAPDVAEPKVDQRGDARPGHLDRDADRPVTPRQRREGERKTPPTWRRS
jgi:hypothetical protein